MYVDRALRIVDHAFQCANHALLPLGRFDRLPRHCYTWLTMATKGRVWRSLYVRRRWLAPGIGIKRWLALLAVGGAILGLGLVYLLLAMNRSGLFPEWLLDLVTLQFLPLALRIVLPVLVGLLLMGYAIVRLGRNLVEPLRPGEGAVVDSLYDYRMRGRGPHIVAIGGGTGMPGLLRGLTPYTANITAIVTVADDGGSSGRLRRDLGLLPPGDFRNNLAALAKDEALMTQVLQYRFGSSSSGNGQSELQGHAFGNLLLAALTGITGSFDEALLAAQRVLALRGQVLPSTLENVTLVADVAVAAAVVDATLPATTPVGTTTAQSDHSDPQPTEPTLVRVTGESAIPEMGGTIKHVYLEPDNARAYPPALKALFQADLIVLGPGSLYTSILPNLLVQDLAEALRHARARKVYVCNIATQPGETDGYTVADHVQALQDHVPGTWLDVVLANHNLSVPPDTGGGDTHFVILDQPQGVAMITADLVDEDQPWRHDSDKLARIIVGLC